MNSVNISNEWHSSMVCLQAYILSTCVVIYCNCFTIHLPKNDEIPVIFSQWLATSGGWTIPQCIINIDVCVSNNRLLVI